MESSSKDQALAALSALAHETRLEIFRCLVKAGSQGLPAGQLGSQLGLPSPTLSFHLKEMRIAGIVRSKKEGRCVFYSADIDAVRSLSSYLTEDCCCGQSSKSMPER
jgi:DNA-binding transcriptional ArsR family regulator